MDELTSGDVLALLVAIESLLLGTGEYYADELPPLPNSISVKE